MAAAMAPEPSSLVHYYCEVGVRNRLMLSRAGRGPSSRASIGAPPLEALFEPSVLRRLPREEQPGMRFAPEVAMFCFPHGVRLVTADVAAANAIPVVTSFVLTAADRSRMYGACIVWFEALPDAVVRAYLDEAGPEALAAHPDAADAGGADTAADAASDADGAAATGAGAAGAPQLHAPEAICLLSREPIFEALNTCCRQLFRMRLARCLTEEALLSLFAASVPSFGRTAEVPRGRSW
jgi:hypothetical protein